MTTDSMLMALSNAELPDNDEPGAPPLPPPPALTAAELRHLLRVLEFEDQSKWDCERHCWTHADDIRRKLLAMLAAMEGKDR